ncbi:hypothetical protein IAR50_000219 [Cryptococcus sp. DSM 104548]
MFPSTLTPRERMRLATEAYMDAQRDEAALQGLSTPVSLAPSLPLPPLPSSPASLRDFNPPASSSQSTRRRSRLSDHGHASETASLGTSRILRRESSIQALRHDIATASRSLRAAKRTSTASTTSDSAWSKRSSEAYDPDLAFLPQALPYPKIGRSLARLSTSTTSSLDSPSFRDPPDKANTVPFVSPDTARLSIASTTSTISIPPSPCSLSFTPSSASDSDSPLAPFDGLAHMSYPSPFAAKGVKPRRRSSLATHVLQAQDDQDDQGEVWVDMGPSPFAAPVPLAKPVLAPAAEIQVVEEMIASPPMSPVKSHQRNDSTLSAIMAFPIPPDRITLPLAAAKDETEETQVEETLQCPPSPQLGDLLKSVPRAKRRRTSVSECDGSETDESDIDMAAPLIQAALDSKILTPRSRLLRQRPSHPASPRRPVQQRTVSSPSIPLHSGGGWSGSESEEEGWEADTAKKYGPRRTASAAALTRGSTTPSPGLRIKVDKDITPKSSRLFSAPPSACISPSLTPPSHPSHKRLSSLSTSTAASASTASTDFPLTPTMSLILPNLCPAQSGSAGMDRKGSAGSEISAASIGVALAGPGDFPWGASSPPNSPVRAAFRRAGSQRSLASYSSSTSFSSFSLSLSRSSSEKSKSLRKKQSKIFTRRQLPPPRQEVEGWGKPEILLDDETWSENDSPSSVKSYTSSRASLHRGLGTIHLDDYSDSEEEEEATPMVSSGRWDATPRAGAGADGETPKPSMDVYGRVPSPEMWMGMDMEVASLMDEGMDGMDSDEEW